MRRASETNLHLTAERIEQELGEERRLNRFEGSGLASGSSIRAMTGRPAVANQRERRLSSVPVTDRGSEEVNVSFSVFGTGVGLASGRLLRLALDRRVHACRDCVLTQAYR